MTPISLIYITNLIVYFAVHVKECSKTYSINRFLLFLLNTQTELNLWILNPRLGKTVQELKFFEKKNEKVEVELVISFLITVI